MNTDQINRWLTLAANIGVLIGIIVLVVEIGQNSEIMRAQMVQARADTMAAQFDAQINADFWPEIRAKRRAANSTVEWIESLSPADYERVYMSYLREVNYLIHLSYQHQEGYIPLEIWNSSVRRQFIRNLELAKIFSQRCATEEPYYEMLRKLADEEGIAVCGRDGHWQPLDTIEPQRGNGEPN